MYHKNRLIIAGLIVTINSIAQGYEPVNVQLSKMNKETLAQIDKLKPSSLAETVDTILTNALKKAVKAAYPHASADKIESLNQSEILGKNLSPLTENKLWQLLPTLYQIINQADTEHQKELDFHMSEDWKAARRALLYKGDTATERLLNVISSPFVYVRLSCTPESDNIKKARSLVAFKFMNDVATKLPDQFAKTLEFDEVRQKVEAHLNQN